MESLVAAFVFTASPGWVAVAGGVLSVLALAVTGMVLRGTAAECESRLLASGRAVCVAVTGLLAAASLLGLLTRWAFGVACVAFLFTLLAVALRYGEGTSLRGYFEGPGGEEEPAWWPVFEHGFRRYAGAPRREQNPLCRAVTRSGMQTVDPDPWPGVRRYGDAMRGGWP